MPRLHELTLNQKEALCQEVMRLFEIFCQQELKKVLYPYQRRVAWAIFHSLLVSRVDVFIKIARQSGKSEVVALVLKFLMVFHLHLLRQPLMAAIASRNGEQAKTLVDRMKRDLLQLGKSFGLEDRENNAHTIRGYRQDLLHCEIFKFSLAPTTSNESKTLNLQVIDEAHKINDKKRRDELAPMLISRSTKGTESTCPCITRSTSRGRRTTPRTPPPWPCWRRPVVMSERSSLLDQPGDIRLAFPGPSSYIELRRHRVTNRGAARPGGWPVDEYADAAEYLPGVRPRRLF